MGINITVTAKLCINVLCLVMGAGILGSLESIPKRGVVDFRRKFICQENAHGRFESFPPNQFNEFFEGVFSK